MLIRIPVAVGELFDKITILRIKAARLLAAVRAPGVAVVFGKTSKTVSETESQMGALTVDEVAAVATRLLHVMR